MQLTLKEPLAPRYIHIDPDTNTVHVFMPVVSGTSIGLDNTCKAVATLQQFFGKDPSNEKSGIKNELLAYKNALEFDLSLLRVDESIAQQKQARLTQIKAYLAVIKHLEMHEELQCLNDHFPSYPKPLEALMQDRDASNLYSIILRPTEQDGYLRSEDTNPVFSVAHSSTARNIENTNSPLQLALMQAYTPLVFGTRDLKSQVMQQTSALFVVPVEFERLRDALQEKINELLKVSVDLTQTQQGQRLTQQDIDTTMGLDSQTATPEEYINALLGYCAPNLFDTLTESPFDTLTQADSWSIATQFLLGVMNIHALSQSKIRPDTNFGRILDESPSLSADLARTLAQAQQDSACIEEQCFSWVNAHASELQLDATFTPQDLEAIKKRFVSLYSQIKDSPHFDEFFILDTQKKGIFFVYQGSICTSFAEFAASPVFDLPEELASSLLTPRTHFKTLNEGNISQQNSWINASVDLNLSSMHNKALQVVYKQITTCQDPKRKEQLLAQINQEQPDFMEQITVIAFLQHVAYGQQDEAEELLKNHPDRSQKLLLAQQHPFTDYPGRTFTCSAYEYAYWAKDTHMCRMLERYMDDTTRLEMLKQIQSMEEYVAQTGLLGFFGAYKKPRGLTYTQNGQEHRSVHFDLTPLKQAIKVYIAAYDNSPKQSDADWDALNTLWLNIGAQQREVPAHIAQEYSNANHSLSYRAMTPSLLAASNPENLTRRLTFYNKNTQSTDLWFNPEFYLTNSDLGETFTIVPIPKWGSNASALRHDQDRAESLVTISRTHSICIEVLDETRTDDLQKSLAKMKLPVAEQQNMAKTLQKLRLLANQTTIAPIINEHLSNLLEHADTLTPSSALNERLEATYNMLTGQLSVKEYMEIAHQDEPALGWKILQGLIKALAYIALALGITLLLAFAGVDPNITVCLAGATAGYLGMSAVSAEPSETPENLFYTEMNALYQLQMDNQEYVDVENNEEYLQENNHMSVSIR